MSRLPVYFIAHGSPMSVLEDNPYTRALDALAGGMPAHPRAIVVVSAHWETRGARVTANEGTQKILYDFGGFPEELYKVRYEAQGDPALAVEIAAAAGAGTALDWGLDHGAWTVLKRLYPEPPAPVLQLSLDRELDLRGHFELARRLRPLRDSGIVLLGSGNIVHNLRALAWHDAGHREPWALEFDAYVAAALDARDWDALLEPERAGEAWRRSAPTAEHYLPALYAAGAAYANEPLAALYEGVHNGSLSMRSWRFG